MAITAGEMNSSRLFLYIKNIRAAERRPRKEVCVMALPRKQLQEKLENLTPENLKETMQWILDAHTTSLEAIQEERDSLKEKAAAADQLKQQLETLQQTSGDAAKIRKELDALKTSVAAEKTAAAAMAHARSLLKNDVGIKRESALELILAAEKLDGYEKDENGQLKDPAAFVNAMKGKYAEWIGEVSTHGVPPMSPPSGGGDVRMTREEIFKKDEKGRYVLSTPERQKAIAENLDIFQNE